MVNHLPSDPAPTYGLQSARVSPLMVFVFLLGMVLLWTVLCGVSHRAPDLDGMEELVWAASFELGYYKHPPFPSWILYGLTSIVGKPIWLVFLAGQLASALALWFVWRLGCEFTTPAKSFIAVLMVSTTAYFSLRGTIYNHNTAQLWSIVACTWLLYRGLRYQKVSSWLWLGAVAALATMTKYSAVIQFAVFFVFLLVQGHLVQAQTWKGLAWALLAFVLVFSPHLYWLVGNDFLPFRYLDASIEASTYADVLKDILDFSLDQLGRISPMVVVWIGLYVWNRRRSAGLGASYSSELSAWDRSFLLWVGLGPFVITVLAAALLGTRLTASWATTFFVLYGFFTFWWLRGSERINLRRTLILVVAVHVLMAVGYAVARGPLAYEAGRTSRSTFPGAQISSLMQDVWRQHVPGTPLRLVASDTWFGGNVAVHVHPDTNVFIDADYMQSPWLDPATALDCGVLVAYSEIKRGPPADALKALHDTARWKGQLTLPWSSTRSPDIVIEWGVIPPGPNCKVLP